MLRDRVCVCCMQLETRCSLLLLQLLRHSLTGACLVGYSCLVFEAVSPHTNLTAEYYSNISLIFHTLVFLLCSLKYLVFGNAEIRNSL
jgi:hypothetical protein